MVIKLDHLDHAGIIVESSDDALDFYTDTLGLELTGQASSEVTGDTYTHLVTRRDDEIESHVELVEASEDSPLAEAGMDDPGLNHIAYRVPDVDSAVEELAENGCEVVLPPTEISEIVFAYVKTPEEYIFEVMAYPDDYTNSAEV